MAVGVGQTDEPLLVGGEVEDEHWVGVVMPLAENEESCWNIRCKRKTTGAPESRDSCFVAHWQTDNHAFF